MQELQSVVDDVRSHVRVGDGEFGELVIRLYEAQSNKGHLRFLSNFGDPGRYGVVPVPVSMFKKGQVRAFDGQATAKWTSSGSTESSRSVVELQELTDYNLAIDTCQEGTKFESLLKASTRAIVMTPPSYAWPNSSLAYMFDRLTRGKSTLYGVLASGDRPKDLSLVGALSERLAMEKSRLGIFTTSYMGVKLLEKMKPITLKKSSFIVDTGGYKGVVRDHSREEFVELAQEKLGLPRENIISEYGMSEMSSHMWSEMKGDLEVWKIPRSIDVEILNPNDEGVGQVVVYDLLNVWTVCALKTDDLGKVVEIDGEEFFIPCGRLPKAEPKGCSLTAERAYRD